jgi:hypothetical protein
MKTILVSFLLAASAAAADAPFTGKWRIHLRISDREADETCTFVQNGADLAGTCTSERGTTNITGKIDNQKITWTYKSESQANGAITLNYRGALNATKDIAGFVKVEEFGVEGEFTATQSN